MTRRRFLAGSGSLGGLTLVAPIAARIGPAFGSAPPDPATRSRNRLVVVFLEGGNDGLNTVVPRDDVSGAPRWSVYRKVRPTLALDRSVSLPLDRPADAPHALGLHPRLTTVHRLYREGRVAIVQGVDYPKHSYSHFTSTDIWHSGEPGRSPSSGWVGRHLDRSGIGEGELRAVALGSDLPLILRGHRIGGAALTSIAATRFGDGSGAEPDARHLALAGFGAFPGRTEPARLATGRVQAQTVGLVDTLRSTPAPPTTGTAIGDRLLTARVLLEHDLGVECVYVTQPGYDTHAAEGPAHDRLLGDLDAAMETFWFGSQRGASVANIGPLRADVASRTLVLVVSEFGRRIGENGGAGVAGTDHGAAAPVLAIGPPLDQGGAVSLVPGLHGDHPDLGSVQLPADNLVQTTDLRRVYQGVLESWLGNPDPLYDRVAALPGLFAARASTPAAPAAGSTAAGHRGSASTGPTAVAPSGVRSSGPPTPAVDVSATAPSDVVSSTDGAIGRRAHGTVATGRPAETLHPVSVGAAALVNLLAALLFVREGGLTRVRAMLRQDRDSAPGPDGARGVPPAVSDERVDVGEPARSAGRRAP